MQSTRKPAGKPARAKLAKKAAKARRGGTPGNRGGTRAGWHPSEAQRTWVVQAARIGTPEKDIAAILGISNNTLRARCAAELDTAHTLANVEVGGAFYRNAMGRREVVRLKADGTEEVVERAVEPNVAAQIFWLKARAGWKETARHEHAGHDGGALGDDRPLERLCGRIARIAERLAENQAPQKP